MAQLQCKPLLVLTVAVVCLIPAMSTISNSQQSSEAIAKEGLLKALGKEVLSSRTLIDQIRRRGVTFKLTSTDEEEIRSAGKYLGKKGLDDLIAAIRRNYAETELHGLLIPATDPSPPTPSCLDKMPPDAVAFYLGNNVIFPNEFPFIVLRVGDEDLLIVHKTPEGLALSATVRSPDNKVVAIIIDNEFYKNPLNYFRREARRDRHTLKVYDQENREVLNVRYLNPSAIKVTGIFRTRRFPPVLVSEDNVISGTREFSGNCIYRPGNVGLNFEEEKRP